MATAFDILTSVRDQIPDPTYTNTGEPQPDTDGGIRQQELLRWLNNAQRIVSRRLRCVKDWTAVSSVANQDVYPLDPRFFALSEVYYDGWNITLSEAPDFFYRGIINGGPAWNYTITEQGGRLSLGLWPFGLRNAGTSNLTNPVAKNDTSFTVASAAGFGASGGPSMGFVWMDTGGGGIGNLGTELVSYRVINTTTGVLSTLQRGRGGTPPLGHNAGAPVTEANIWVHGWRTARPVSLVFNTNFPLTRMDPGFTPPSYPLGMSDPLDIPDQWSYMLETYILSKVREKENDRNEAKSLMDQFNAEVNDAAADPAIYGRSQGHQVRTAQGGLVYGRIIVP